MCIRDRYMGAEIIWAPQIIRANHEHTPKMSKSKSQATKIQQIVPSKSNLSFNQKDKLKPELPFINLEKDNYIQDIVRRKLLFNTLDAEKPTDDYMKQLKEIQKQPRKRTRLHKTKFKILKSNNNINTLQNIICNFIDENKKFINTEVVSIPAYEKNAPFLPQTLNFADQLIVEKQQFKEKYGYDEKNLVKNKCLLEQVILNRLNKRQQAREKNKLIKNQIKTTIKESKEQKHKQ
eukprot:TRINITY_DN27864_c0_g1_i4.p1 TRINITY_DN27864_c0_g1~~TRINITY_DN27864_c0_g1_i4.p1  ORF type:complete len:235 (-),score=53.12 TRINITY_DN27864_c0_g1_i4:37-741(-)